MAEHGTRCIHTACTPFVQTSTTLNNGITEHRLCRTPRSDREAVSLNGLALPQQRLVSRLSLQ
eukprot:7317877-Alexandrium_andersonii.AAC.1